MTSQDPSTPRFQKPVTRRDWTGPAVQEFSQGPHPLIIGFLWMLPTALLSGTVIWLGKFGHLIGDALRGLGISGGRGMDNLGTVILLLMMLAFIAGPGWIFAILTMRGSRDRKDLGFRAFQFFYVQILLIPFFLLALYLISRLFV